MFLEKQISILEGFLKGHATLKTGDMMLKIILKSKTVILKCNNILQQ